jgi:hypothetical protein
MSGEAQFWIGLALSIPIGIGTSLVTPAIQRWFESRGQARVISAKRETEAEYRAAVFYRKNSDRFTQYLVHVTIKATLVGALIGAVTGACFFVAQLADTILARQMDVTYDRVRQLLYALGQGSALVGSIAVFNICRPALATWTRVRNFDEYQRSVAQDVRDAVDQIEILDGPY